MQARILGVGLFVLSYLSVILTTTSLPGMISLEVDPVDARTQGTLLPVGQDLPASAADRWTSSISPSDPVSVTGQADLAPFTPPEYESPVVPANIPGTPISTTLFAGAMTYFDWHFINYGEVITDHFAVELWLDDTLYLRQSFSGHAAGVDGGFDDYTALVAVAGWHTVRLVTDADDTVAEADEENNIWEQDFYWSPVNGWLGEYFNNETLEGYPALVRDDPAIDFYWRASSPGSAVVTDGFSARWRGEKYFLAGMYQFSVGHDDGARLWIDDFVVLDEWANCCRTDTNQVDLTDGYHLIRLEMYDHYGFAEVNLGWEQIAGERRIYLPMLRKE